MKETAVEHVAWTHDASSPDGDERFRILADCMPQLVWSAGSDGVVDYYNARAAEYDGIVRNELGYYEWAPVVHPRDLDLTVAAWNGAVANRVPYACEHRIRMRSGEWRWHLSRATPVFDEDGSITRWYGTATDVHSVKANEEARRLSEDRLKLALLAGRMGDWSWDSETGKVALSPRAAEIYGVDATEISLADLRRSIHIEGLAEVRDAMVSAVRENRDFVAEYRITRPDGVKRWISARGLPSRPDPGGPLGLTGVVKDITEQRNADEHRALLLTELSHRVKNTLAVVQGIARQSFRDGVELASARSEFEERLASLASAHDLLAGEAWDAVGLSELLLSQLQILKAERRATLKGPAVRLTPRVAVNIAMAVHELATNATKYGALSTADGRLKVEWTSADGMIDLRWSESGGPTVRTPTRKGFGTRMLSRAVSADLGGQVDLQFPPEGVRCQLRFPVDAGA